MVPPAQRPPRTAQPSPKCTQRSHSCDGEINNMGAAVATNPNCVHDLDNFFAGSQQGLYPAKNQRCHDTTSRNDHQRQQRCVDDVPKCNVQGVVNKRIRNFGPQDNPEKSNEGGDNGFLYLDRNASTGKQYHYSNSRWDGNGLPTNDQIPDSSITGNSFTRTHGRDREHKTNFPSEVSARLRSSTIFRQV